MSGRYEVRPVAIGKLPGEQLHYFQVWDKQAGRPAGTVMWKTERFALEDAEVLNAIHRGRREVDARASYRGYTILD